MARIVVHRASFESGTFPPICCKTGVHTDNYETWEFSRGVNGRLPIAPGAHRSADRLRRAAWVTGLVAVALAIAGGVFDIPALYAAVIVWMIGSILAVRATPNAKPVGDEAIELSNVHRRFVDTIRSAWAQQNQPGA